MSNFQFGVKKISSLNADDFVSINKPGEYLHRVLVGGDIIESVFCPIVVFDEDEQQLKQSFRVLKRDTKKGSAILDKLIEIDLMFKRQNVNPIENKNIRSQFTSTKKWIYLIFDRTNPEIVLKVAQYPWTVAKELNNLQDKLDTDDRTLLRYGPTFSWDAIITHEYDKNKKGADYSKHSYKVEVDPKSKFNGQFPAVILDSNRFPNPIDALDDKSKAAVFNEAEWKAINNTTLNIEEILKPNTEEEIMQLLTGKNQIFFEATKDGIPLFPHVELIKEELHKQGLSALISDIKINTGLPSAILGEEPKKELKEEQPKIALASDTTHQREIVIEPTEAQKNKTKNKGIDIVSPKSEQAEKTEDEVDNTVLSTIQAELKQNKEKNEAVQTETKVKAEVVEKKEDTTQKIVLNFNK